MVDRLDSGTFRGSCRKPDWPTIVSQRWKVLRNGSNGPMNAVNGLSLTWAVQ